MKTNKKLVVWIFNTDRTVLEGVKEILNKEYNLTCFNSYDDLLLNIAEEEPDLIILDWIFSSKSGLDIIKKIQSRSQSTNIGLLVLTERALESDKLKAFELGIDDYLTIPFLKTELVARIRAILRRIKKGYLSSVLESSTIKMDRNSRMVTRNGREIELGPTEFNLLEYLMLNKGKVLNRIKILEKAWLKDEEIDLRTVDVHILRLRNALIIDNEPDPIRTVRGIGYVFED